MAIGMTSLTAFAQSPAGSGRVDVSPSLTFSETLTSRRNGVTGENTNEAVTTISPGVRVASRTGRLQGSVDYSLDGVLNSRDSSANEVRHRLAAAGAAEVVERHLYIDMTGSISRQPISAFGVLSADPLLTDKNTTDVRSFSISPVLRGNVAGVVDVQARWHAAVTSTGTTSASDSSSNVASVRLGSAAGRARVGWSLDLSRQVVDFDLGRRTEEDRAVVGVSFAATPELRLTARVGVEEGDLVSLQRERTNTYGVGLLWTPTVRTKLAIDLDRRAFGHSHQVSFEHRMRRSVWRFSDSQDLTNGASAQGATVPAFDLFFSLFQAQEPDPFLREQLVNSFLQRNNLDPSTLVNGGFLTSASALQRRQELSFAVEGVRTTFVVSGNVTSSRRAFGTVVGGDDLSAGGLQQRGLTVAAMYRLTPSSTLGLTASTQHSDSDTAGLFSRLNSITANWTDRIGRRTTMSLGVRHSDFESGTDAYRENALLANVRMSF